MVESKLKPKEKEMLIIKKYQEMILYVYNLMKKYQIQQEIERINLKLLNLTKHKNINKIIKKTRNIIDECNVKEE